MKRDKIFISATYVSGGDKGIMLFAVRLTEELLSNITSLASTASAMSDNPDIESIDVNIEEGVLQAINFTGDNSDSKFHFWDAAVGMTGIGVVVGMEDDMELVDPRIETPKMHVSPDGRVWFSGEVQSTAGAVIMSTIDIRHQELLNGTRLSEEFVREKFRAYNEDGSGVSAADHIEENKFAPGSWILRPNGTVMVVERQNGKVLTGRRHGSLQEEASIDLRFEDAAILRLHGGIYDDIKE